MSDISDEKMSSDSGDETLLEIDMEVTSCEEVEKTMGVKPSIDKNTSLHMHAALGLINNVIENLERPGTKIDAENFMGWTPLMMAVRNGRIDVVNLLLEKGADVTKKNKLGANIFAMSIATGNIDLMKIILRHMLYGGISRNRVQESISPISLAILYNKTDLVTWLVEQGFDVNLPTPKTHITPLMFSVATKNQKITELLKKSGAKDVQNYMGLNIDDLMFWGKKGLERLIESKKPLPKIEFPTEPAPKTIFPGPPLKLDTKPLKKAPTSVKSKELKVPNNTPCVAGMSPQFECFMLPNNIKSPNVIAENQLNTQKTEENVFKYDGNAGAYFAYLPVPYPNYMPVMNSPMAPMTPLMVAPPYQNSPMGMMPSPLQFVHPNMTPEMQMLMPQHVPMDHRNNYYYPNHHVQSNIFYQYSPSQEMFRDDS